eukprot:763450-Hanusia_phi.AAC.5
MQGGGDEERRLRKLLALLSRHSDVAKIKIAVRPGRALPGAGPGPRGPYAQSDLSPVPLPRAPHCTRQAASVTDSFDPLSK